MSKAKVNFIPNHVNMKCWSCEGKGCKVCKGTGIWVEEHYYLIYTDKNGVKHGFGVDGLK
jgi:hypothetical protein